MRGYISPERYRHILTLSTEMERLRTAIRALLADVERIDDLFQQLTRDRTRHVTRDALNILRTANGPMGLREITLRVMAAQGEDATDRKAVGRRMEKLRISLTRQAAAGILLREKGPGWTVLWSVAGMGEPSAMRERQV